MTIKVLIADSQPLFSEALSVTLGQFDDLEILEANPTGALDAVQAAIALRPHVALIDQWMQDLAGAETARAIFNWVPDTKILMMSWLHGSVHIRAALEAGAAGFLPKSMAVADVAEAIRNAHAGQPIVFGEQLAQLAHRIDERRKRTQEAWSKIPPLTPRELQILGLLSLGRGADDIAERLFLSPRTVNDHIHNLLGKLGVRSSAQAVTFAMQKGLFDTSSTQRLN